MLLIYAVFQSQLLSAAGDEYAATINSEDFAVGQQHPEMSVQVPRELVVQLSSDDSGGGGEVRAVSFVYYDVESLFPNQGPQESKWVKKKSEVVTIAEALRPN